MMVTGLNKIKQEIEEKRQKKKKHTKKIDKPKIIFKSRMVFENELWEQVYDGKTSQYAVWDGANVTYKQMLQIDDETIMPINDDTLTEGAVILPNEALEYENTKELLIEIRGFIHDYVDISMQMEHLASWYVLLTWVSDKLKTLCYLRARGDTGVGKTRFEDTIGYLCYHATKAAGCVTPAPIYRLIRLWRGTVILDEADFRQSDESAEVIKILNCGFQKSTPVIRCSINNPDKLQILPVYGPKILATRQPFHDKALESRCLTEIMRKTNRQDIPVDLPKEFFERAKNIRNKCLMFRFKNYHNIDPDVGIDLDLGRLEPRIKQAVISFPALFHSDPEVMEEFKTFLIKHQQEIIDERAQSFDGVMINCLAELIIEKMGLSDTLEVSQTTLNGNMPKLNQIVITASNLGDYMSGQYFSGDKKVHPRTIGKHLKSFGIGIGQPKKHEGKTVKPIKLDDGVLLENIFRGYLNDEILLKKVTQVTHVTLHRGVDDFSNHIYGQAERGEEGVTQTPLPPIAGNLGNSVTLINHGKPRNTRKPTPKSIVLAVIRKAIDPTSKIADLQDVLLICEERGVPEQDVDDILTILKRDGNIYEPKPGYIGELS